MDKCHECASEPTCESLSISCSEFPGTETWKIDPIADAESKAKPDWWNDAVDGEWIQW